VTAIVAKCLEQKEAVQGFALSCLTCLAYLFPLFNKFDKEIIGFIFSALSNQLYAMSIERVDSTEKQPYISNLLNSMLVF